LTAPIGLDLVTSACIAFATSTTAGRVKSAMQDNLSRQVDGRL